MSEPNMVNYMRTVRDCLKQRDVSAALRWANTALTQAGCTDWRSQPSEHVSEGHVGAQQQGARPRKGELFVRGDVPAGPYEARLAWARALGNCATVVEVFERKGSGLVDVSFEVARRPGSAFGAGQTEFLEEWRRP